MLKSIPKVSIIMPTYNRADLVTETIESIRNQTYSHWELLVMDDGSDDNTEMIVEQLKDERIKFFKAGRTGKVTALKNTGMEKTNGDFIAFIDSDDVWQPSKLEKQVDAMQQHPEAGFCLTSGYNFKQPGEPIEFFYKTRIGMRYDNIFIDLFQSRVAAFTQTLLFRKDCVAVAGFFNEEKLFSDFGFIASLASYFNAIILYEPLVFRRLHSCNHSTPNWKENCSEGIEVIKSHRAQLPSAVVRNALFRSNINFGEKYLAHKQRKNAIRQFLKSWYYKPLSIIPAKKMAKAVLYYLQGK